MNSPFLQVDQLFISFPTPQGLLQAVRGISFSLAAGQSLGIVGESGSGKSSIAHALIGLCANAQVQGSILLEGRSLLGLSEKSWQTLRGNTLSMMFQDPFTSLNPTQKVGLQIAEGLIHHRLQTKAQARQSALEFLDRVGIPDPNTHFHVYPHQLSGGMRQRVCLAMALICRPRLLIIDEPTTALDRMLQKQMLTLIKQLQHSLQTALVVISHDLSVIQALCEEVFVMYSGVLVERGLVQKVLSAPQHPYTKMLLAALPSHRLKGPLLAIEGELPSPLSPPKGCPFYSRCPYAFEKCTTPPPIQEGVACWRAYDAP